MDIEYRKAKISDAQGIINIMKKGIKSGSWKYTLRNTFDKTKLDRLKKNLKDKNSTQKIYIAYDNESKKVIGSLFFGLEDGRFRHKVELGWNILDEYSGRGITTNLVKFVLVKLKKMGIKKVGAEMAKENIGSYKIALKCGFKEEGIKKFGMIGDKGQRIDMIIMGKILD